MKGWYEKVKDGDGNEKNPTLFKREFQDHRGTGISLELSSTNLAWVLADEGTATEKIDGASTKVSNH